MSGAFNREAVPKCNDRLQKAKRALDHCRKSSNFSEFYAHWSEFLIHGGSVLNALEAGSKETPQGRQWYGRIKREGRADELVNYMHQARNSEEHDTSPTTIHVDGAILIGLPGDSVHISHIDTGDPMLWQNPKDYLSSRAINMSTNLPASVISTPHGPALCPVTHRGVKVMPPKKHGGRDLASQDPLRIGFQYLAYLQGLISVATSAS